MTSRLRFCNAHFGSAHCLIRKPLQPQHSREVRARRYPQVRVEANNMRVSLLGANDSRSMIRGCAISQHLPQMMARTDVVTKKMLGHPHHAPAEQPIIQVQSRRQIMELLRKWQCSTISAARVVIGIKTPQGAQLVLGVAKLLRNVECLCERRA